MNKIKKTLESFNVSDIIPYPNNPRNNEEAITYVVESIKQCGYCDPIEVDEDNVILSGHTRLAACKRLGIESVDVVKIFGLTEEQKRKYRILANKTAEIAEWDVNKLEEELEGLDFGEFDFGFDTFSIDDMEVVEGFNAEEDEREFFNKTFCFPIEKKQKITNYLKKHYDEVIARIIHDSEANY